MAGVLLPYMSAPKTMSSTAYATVEFTKLKGTYEQSMKKEDP